ncbi:MAG: YbaB/EbfC family nucleoid-associated protein [Acidimicrobiia bacterium]|nr:YbaB/EbfC family nucleoid-associated protein [Acidimicrobiia bacterium]
MGRLPKDMQKLLEQASAMQAKMQEAQQAAADQDFEGTAGGGMVKAVVKGSGEVVSVTFDPSALDPEDPELVGDLVVAALNQAQQAAQEALAGGINEAAGGMDLDSLGLGGLLG